MKKGNVLVIGNSGVGKSTLINAVLGKDVAATGWGSKGTTKELKIYGDDSTPFNVIDTVGFEPSFIKEKGAIHAVKKWSKESVKKGGEEKQINMIWFCVEGTTSKLFPKSITNLSRATSMWKGVPVIVVITKSYSTSERETNVKMVQNAFAQQKHFSLNLKEILPVVAQPYIIDDTTFVNSTGIMELINATQEHMEEGFKSTDKAIAKFKLGRKRALAHSTAVVATAAGAVVGIVPTQTADAKLLRPIEETAVRGIAKVYEIPDNEDFAKTFERLIAGGTVGAAAKAISKVAKKLPTVKGIPIDKLVNPVVAASIVLTLCETSIKIYEKIYLGEVDKSNLDWVDDLLDKNYDEHFVDKTIDVIGKVDPSSSKKEIVASVIDGFAGDDSNAENLLKE